MNVNYLLFVYTIIIIIIILESINKFSSILDEIFYSEDLHTYYIPLRNDFLLTVDFDDIISLFNV